MGNAANHYLLYTEHNQYTKYINFPLALPPYLWDYICVHMLH